MIFRPNPRFVAELKRDPGVRSNLEDAAEKVAQGANSLTPHAPGSFTVEGEGETVTVGSTDPFMHLVEWGSVNNQPYAPLRRAVRAAGLRFEETN